MTFDELKKLLKSDLYRHDAIVTLKYGIRLFLKEPEYRYTVLMRTCKYLHENWRPLYYPVKFWLTRMQYKYGISIPFQTNIGPGFFLNHYDGMFVNINAVIGANCNISQGVSVGGLNRGSKQGCPVIGDNVHLGAGCKVIGNLRIGNNVIVGVNSVVNQDVPDNAVVMGVPAVVINMKGSKNAVVNRWGEYDLSH